MGAQPGLPTREDVWWESLNEVARLESWWDEPHCESPHRPGTPNCSHVPVARYSAECLRGQWTIRVCANAAEYVRSRIAGYRVCECRMPCRDCWTIEPL